MPKTMAATVRQLRESLDRDLEMYERHVPSKEILIEYVTATKLALLQAVNEAFDDKIESLMR